MLTPPEHENVLRGELGVRQRVTWTDDISLEHVKASSAMTAGVTVGLRVDAGLISDPEVIIEAFQHELEQMAHLRNRPKPQPVGRGTTNRRGDVRQPTRPSVRRAMRAACP